MARASAALSSAEVAAAVDVLAPACGVEVVSVHLEALGEPRLGHGRAHQAEPDEADSAGHRSLPAGARPRRQAARAVRALSESAVTMP